MLDVGGQATLDILIIAILSVECHHPHFLMRGPNCFNRKKQNVINLSTWNQLLWTRNKVTMRPFDKVVGRNLDTSVNIICILYRWKHFKLHSRLSINQSKVDEKGFSIIRECSSQHDERVVFALFRHFPVMSRVIPFPTLWIIGIDRKLSVKPSKRIFEFNGVQCESSTIGTIHCILYILKVIIITILNLYSHTIKIARIIQLGKVCQILLSN